MIRTYSDLMQLGTYEERLEYLRLRGVVGSDTFGFDRYLNQKFYRSPEWKRVRDEVIVRDNGCDLGLPGYEIGDRIFVHHMNPIDISDIQESPDYLICVSKETHDAIHYGADMSEYYERKRLVERSVGDTKLW